MAIDELARGPALTASPFSGIEDEWPGVCIAELLTVRVAPEWPTPASSRLERFVLPVSPKCDVAETGAVLEREVDSRETTDILEDIVLALSFLALANDAEELSMRPSTAPCVGDEISTMAELTGELTSFLDAIVGSELYPLDRDRMLAESES